MEPQTSSGFTCWRAAAPIEEDGSFHRRPKRARYVSNACDECKRRKVRCDGKTPCGHCRKKSTYCQYSERQSHQDDDDVANEVEPAKKRRLSEDVSDHKSTSPQFGAILDRLDSLETLTRNLGVCLGTSIDSFPRESYASPKGVTDITTEHPQSPPYLGPTSSASVFKAIQSALRGRGIDTNESFSSLISSPAAIISDALVSALTTTKSPGLRPGRSYPSCPIGKERALRLCKLFEDYVGSMYPLVDVATLRDKIDCLYTSRETTRTSGAVAEGPSSQPSFSEHELLMLKMVFGISLALESGGSSKFGERMVDEVREFANDILWQLPDLRFVQIYMLMALYYVHINEDILANRATCIASRMCLELGLHKQDVVDRISDDPKKRVFANNLFWSVYMMDRRSSLIHGLPSVIQDCEVDAALMPPQNSHLGGVLELARLIGQTYHHVNEMAKDSNKFALEKLDFLDFQVQRWYGALSDDLKLENKDTYAAEAVNCSSLFIRALMRARKNQARVDIFRPVLASATRISAHFKHALALIEAAQDTVEVLDTLCRTTSVYDSQPVVFNYYVMSSLAVFVLASVHAPLDFVPRVATSFENAIKLAKTNRGVQGHARQRERIAALEQLGSILGLDSTKTSAQEKPLENQNAQIMELWGASLGELNFFSMPGDFDGFFDPVTGSGQMQSDISGLW